jgi:hypothetical protein
MDAFEIGIVTQGWIDEDTTHAQIDLCSHGQIRLVFDGHTIESGDRGNDYTISTSALALLRTVESDHSPDRPVATRLVLHCGMLSLLSCPIGIDWSISHLDGRVRLADVVRYDSVDVTEATHFQGLTLELFEPDYRRAVVAFADEARTFFAGAAKAIEDDGDRAEYAAFWQEYDERLERARSASG